MSKTPEIYTYYDRLIINIACSSDDFFGGYTSPITTMFKYGNPKKYKSVQFIIRNDQLVAASYMYYILAGLDEWPEVDFLFLGCTDELIASTHDEYRRATERFERIGKEAYEKRLESIGVVNKFWSRMIGKLLAPFRRGGALPR